MGTSSSERSAASFAEVLSVTTEIAMKTAARDMIPFDALIAEIDCFSILIIALSFEQVIYHGTLACWSVCNKADIGPEPSQNAILPRLSLLKDFFAPDGYRWSQMAVAGGVRLSLIRACRSS